MKTLELQVDSRGVATLTLAREEKRNALSSEMIEELSQLCHDVSVDTAVRVVVLAAKGPVFCAGGDLAWMQAQMGATAETRRSEALKLARMFRAVDQISKPVIARVSGDAFGGGIGLIAVTDAAVAVPNAKFGLTETRLGLIPATIGPYVAARLGPAHARRIMASPRLFGAEEAQKLGLISKIRAPSDLDAAIEAEVSPYLSAAPGAVARTKEMVRALGPAIDDAVLEASAERLVAAWEDPEAIEGTTAFFQKRAPFWRA